MKAGVLKVFVGIAVLTWMSLTGCAAHEDDVAEPVSTTQALCYGTTQCDVCSEPVSGTTASLTSSDQQVAGAQAAVFGAPTCLACMQACNATGKFTWTQCAGLCRGIRTGGCNLLFNRCVAMPWPASNNCMAIFDTVCLGE